LSGRILNCWFTLTQVADWVNNLSGPVPDHNRSHEVKKFRLDRNIDGGLRQILQISMVHGQNKFAMLRCRTTDHLLPGRR